jgi:polysaccharide biosynthesis protein PslH
LRDYYLARELARRVSLIYVGIGIDTGIPPTGASSSLQQAGISFERALCLPKEKGYKLWNIIRGFVGNTPISILNYTSQRVTRELKLLLADNEVDVVQIEGIHLANYIPTIRACSPRSRIVCDWHNIESDVMAQYSRFVSNLGRSLYARRTASLLKRAERQLVAACDAHIVVSNEDAARLRKIVSDPRVHVIENGVDIEKYSAVTPRSPGASDTHQRLNIVFVGSMDYHANIQAAVGFVQDTWPLIHRQYPQLQFLLVGSNPANSVRELQKVPGVTVTGTVDDVRLYYMGAFAAVVPLRVGGGSRLKILEAMAAGVPVISTQVGAEGLAVEHGKNILIADTSYEIVDAVKFLLESQKEWQCLASAGHEFVKRGYDWAMLGERLYTIHRQLVTAEPPSGRVIF